MGGTRILGIVPVVAALELEVGVQWSLAAFAAGYIVDDMGFGKVVELPLMRIRCSRESDAKDDADVMASADDTAATLDDGATVAAAAAAVSVDDVICDGVFVAGVVVVVVVDVEPATKNDANRRGGGAAVVLRAYDLSAARGIVSNTGTT